MIRSEKLKHKLIESTHLLPYENLLLLDLPGEIWKPFPVVPFDEGYVVSNKGRVKRIAHTILRSDGVIALLPEKIIKQTVNYYFNRFLREKVYSLICKVSSDAKRTGFLTSRMVYHAFVESFDLYDRNLYIRTKDGNGLNCHPENLYLFERKNLTRWILDHGRKDPLPGISDRSKFSAEEIERWYDTYRKTVSQYDLNGNLIRTFKSRTEAAKFIGINNTQISAAIKGKTPTAGGFLWREGTNSSPKIEVPHIIRPVRVAKYSLEGNLICVYSTIAETSQNVNLSASVIADRIYGRSTHRRFILKVVEENAELPAKITVELPQEKKINWQKYGVPEGRNYPFQNLSLEDIPGEIWKAIPDTDGIYWISNLGRVKAIDRMFKDVKGHNYLKSGQILRQSVIRESKTIHPFLIAHYKIRKKTSNKQVGRLVYSCFKGEVPSKYTVIYKDNDPFNCTSENLELQSLSHLRKGYYVQGRLSGRSHYKPIAQYTLDGQHIKTYPSLKDASEQTGLSSCKISECANGKGGKNENYIWKYL